MTKSNAEKFEDALLNLGDEPTMDQVKRAASNIDPGVTIDTSDFISFNFTDSSVSEQDIIE